MLDRTIILAFAVAGLGLTAPSARTLAAAPPATVRLASLTTAVTADDDENKGKEKHEKEDDEGEEKGKKKEVEQKVPVAMVPAAVMDAVKKEVPDGTVTEAELVAKKGKIMYCFDVKAGDMAYEVKVTVDGKFFSKKVDDDKDDKDKDDKDGKGDKAEKK